MINEGCCQPTNQRAGLKLPESTNRETHECCNTHTHTGTVQGSLHNPGWPPSCSFTFRLSQRCVKVLLQCLVEVRAHKQREETLRRARFNTQGRGDGKTGLKELGGGGVFVGGDIL